MFWVVFWFEVRRNKHFKWTKESVTDCGLYKLGIGSKHAFKACSTVHESDRKRNNRQSACENPLNLHKCWAFVDSVISIPEWSSGVHWRNKSVDMCPCRSKPSLPEALSLICLMIWNVAILNRHHYVDDLLDESTRWVIIILLII